MHQGIANFIGAALVWVVCYTPKQTICVLRGFPSYEDNLVAIYEQLLKRGFRRIVWVTDDLTTKPPIEIDGSTRFVLRGSWQDYWYSILARYLFITHGHFINRSPSNQFCVNLWHGIPYKLIGKLDGQAGRVDTMVVATSELTQDIFAKSFGIETSRVAITGQARTDRLFVENRQALRQRVFPGVDQNTKIFLWLPTYRTTQYSGGRTDGNHFDNVFNCSEFDQDEFNRYLVSHNSICFVKPHPMALQQRPTQNSNLVYVDENWLQEQCMTLYQFAGLSDCLISDISSIIVDFMLLDRPIVLMFEDIKEYESSRGFSFNPIADWLPAPVALNFGSFMDEVDAVVRGEDLHRAKRNELKSVFFEFDDAGSAARILDCVFNHKKLDKGYPTPATPQQ